ncbi:MAG TPA: hypothetical protein VFC65_11960 [Prolixibacteraceae bacterium]|nr:hypothetical protein [Prolixibacteraceae bacterium]
MKPLIFFAVVMGVALMTSCNKYKDEATGAGDALIFSKKIGSETVYGISIYAYTFSSFKSVQAVSSAEDVTYTLKSNQERKTNFYYVTPDENLSTTPPVASTYNFSAVFENGATDEFQDVLTSDLLAPATIENCAYNTTGSKLEITWASLSGADNFGINIMDGTKVVFSSAIIANTVVTYPITSSTAGWVTGVTPESGKTYTVRIYAYLYESAINSYNIQASSVAEKTVIWGE